MGITVLRFLWHIQKSLRKLLIPVFVFLKTHSQIDMFFGSTHNPGEMKQWNIPSPGTVLLKSMEPCHFPHSEDMTNINKYETHKC